MQFPAKKHLYAVVGSREPERLDRLVTSAFAEGDRYKLHQGQWVVACEQATAAGAFELLKTSESLTCVVIPMRGDFYGWHDLALWQWVGERL